MTVFIRKTFIFCFIILVIIFGESYAKMKMNPSKEFGLLKSNLPSTDVIIFGSSVDGYTAKDDTDRRKMSEMLDSILPSRNVTGISHGAFHSEIFLDFINYIIKAEVKKPFIIVPINLRSFSPGWDLQPRYQFVREKYEILGFPYVYDFRNYNGVSDNEYRSQPIFYKEEYLGKYGEITAQYYKQDKSDAKRNGLILNYMQTISTNHRKLTALTDIAKLCRLNNIGLMMYITPIDIRKAEELNLDGFRMKVASNLSVIKQSLENESVDLLDMSFDLESKYFDYKLIPNEHLNMYGKIITAKRIKEKFIELRKSQTQIPIGK